MIHFINLCLLVPVHEAQEGERGSQLFGKFNNHHDKLHANVFFFLLLYLNAGVFFMYVLHVRSFSIAANRMGALMGVGCTLISILEFIGGINNVEIEEEDFILRGLTLITGGPVVYMMTQLRRQIWHLSKTMLNGKLFVQIIIRQHLFLYTI